MSHRYLPLSPRDRLAFYTLCDCLDCRRSMSFDEPVNSFTRGLLVPKSVDCGRYGTLNVYPDGSYTFAD
jgi:hypothetical protein